MDEENLDELTTAELHELSNKIKAELRERKGYYCRECEGFQQNFDTSNKSHDFDDYKEEFGGLCQSCFQQQTQLAALNRISEQLIGERICGVENEQSRSTQTVIKLGCGVELYQGVPTQVVDDYPYLFDDDTEEIEEQVRAGQFEETACRECGCTDSIPCDGGCLWVDPDLCSKCSDEELEQKEGDSAGN